MKSVLRNRKVWLLAAGVLVLLLGAAAWLERGSIQAWYYLRCLACADDANRDLWVDRVARIGSASIPGLLGCLKHDDDRGCTNAERALLRLSENRGADDSRRNDLAHRLVDAFPKSSPAGQRAILRIFTAWLQGEADEGVSEATVLAAARLMTQASRCEVPTVRGCALEMAPLLLERPGHPEFLADCRELIHACLTDADVGNRVRAIQCAAQPALCLLEQVVPLLEDPAPEVRREAMRVVGPLPAIVTTDHLLRWLQDSDADVRLLCEAMLRSRGFQGKHLKLARLITDANPTVRMQVLDYLNDDSDLEPGVWLRRLSIDEAPEVRVAAVRAAAENPLVDLSDRLDQMARSDPSPTVARQARYYLSAYPRNQSDR